MTERAMYPVEASFMKSSQDILPSFDGNGRPQSKGRWLALTHPRSTWTLVCQEL